jgi:hypothetical protein
MHARQRSHTLGKQCMFLHNLRMFDARAHSRPQMAVERVYVGPIMTSLDMAGISLTLLLLDDPRARLLDAPTAAPGWPAASALRVRGKVPVPVPVGRNAGARVSAGTIVHTFVRGKHGCVQRVAHGSRRCTSGFSAE